MKYLQIIKAKVIMTIGGILNNQFLLWEIASHYSIHKILSIYMYVSYTQQIPQLHKTRVLYIHTLYWNFC